MEKEGTETCVISLYELDKALEAHRLSGKVEDDKEVLL